MAHLSATTALDVSATDLETALRIHVQVQELEGSGATCVGAELLASVVSACEDPTLTLAIEGEHLLVTGERKKFKLQTSPADDYPELFGEREGGVRLHFDAAELRTRIDKSLFAVSNEMMRFAIHGLLWQGGDMLYFVATDGRRLATVKTDAVAGLDNELKLIVPKPAMAELRKLLASADSDEQVAIDLYSREIRAHVGDSTFASTLVEGNYPNWREAFPKEKVGSMTVPVVAFAAALRQAQAMTTEDTRTVMFDFAEDGVRMQSRDPSRGKAEIGLACEYIGEPLQAQYNPSYLLDALATLDDDECTVLLYGPDKPCVIGDGPNVRHLIMPIKFKGDAE